MTSATPATYTLDVRGRRVEVVLGTDGRRNSALLLIDGQDGAEGDAGLWDDVTLAACDVKVTVSWWWFGRPAQVVLLDRVEDGLVPYVDKVPFDAPAGTRAARLQQLQRERPRIFAARHVGTAVAKIAASVLGLGALVALLLSWVDPLLDWLLGWLPDWSLWDSLPDWSLPDWLPDWSLPDWLPDLSMPDWLAWLLDHDVAQWVRWTALVLLAVGAAATEVERRRRRERRLKAPAADSPAEPDRPRS